MAEAVHHCADWPVVQLSAVMSHPFTAIDEAVAQIWVVGTELRGARGARSFRPVHAGIRGEPQAVACLSSQSR